MAHPGEQKRGHGEMGVNVTHCYRHGDWALRGYIQDPALRSAPPTPPRPANSWQVHWSVSNKEEAMTVSLGSPQCRGGNLLLTPVQWDRATEYRSSREENVQLDKKCVSQRGGRKGHVVRGHVMSMAQKTSKNHILRTHCTESSTVGAGVAVKE